MSVVFRSSPEPTDFRAPSSSASRRLSPVALALSTLLAGGGVGTPALAVAQGVAEAARPSAAAVRYELPSMPMAQALDAIARDFKLSVDVGDAKLGNLRSRPVVGLHTARSAAAAALEGSGLVVADGVDGVLKVRPHAVALNAVIVLGAKRNQAETGFKADYSSTSARNGVSLQETPAGVTVITSKVIESQQATSLLDVMNNVSSVVVTSGSQGGAGLSIRGFGNSPILSNGLASSADSRATASSLPNVATVERVEVLKGPQAILAGAGVLGGAVNVVKKKPQEDPLHTVTIQRGSRDDTTLTADLSGAALADDKRLTYRLITTNSTETTSAAGFDGRRNSLVSPALRWKDGKTDVTVSLTYQRERSAPTEWTSSVDGVIQPPLAGLPGNRSDGIDLATNKASMDLEQQLPFNLTLISRLERETTQQKLHLYTPLVNMEPATQNIAFMGNNTDEHYTTVSGDHYLRAKLDTGPVEHKIAAGFSHVKSKRFAIAFQTEGFFPVRLTDKAATLPVFTGQVENNDHSDNTQRGLYLQDMLRWNDTSVMVGVRRTKYRQGDSYVEPASGATRFTPAISYTATNSTLGVVQSITDNISVYGMVGKGVQPQYQQSWCGATTSSPKETALKPMETTNKEIGAKFELLNGKLALTTGFFDLTQTGRPEYVANRSCYIMVDGLRNRGLDVDLQGQLARGLNVIANYTRSNIKGILDPLEKFDGQPKYQGSVWLNYQLPWAQVQGLGVGFGVSVHGKSTAGAAYTPVPTVVPAWTRTDASLFYEKGPWTATLGVKNLSGKRIYGFSPMPVYIPVLYDGRDVRMTLGYRFD
jgi:iron complex outermembrane recepter protein